MLMIGGLLRTPACICMNHESMHIVWGLRRLKAIRRSKSKYHVARASPLAFEAMRRGPAPSGKGEGGVPLVDKEQGLPS